MGYAWVNEEDGAHKPQFCFDIGPIEFSLNLLHAKLSIFNLVSVSEQAGLNLILLQSMLSYRDKLEYRTFVCK